LQALRVSVVTTSVSLLIIVVLGTPLAYVLARKRNVWTRLLSVWLDVPLVLPPVVAGVGLLLVFGRRGLLGGWLEPLALAFSPAAVIVAQVFVASPLYVRSLKAGFASMHDDLEASATTLGANPWQVFWHITLPLARPALVEGSLLAWARAVGEFGATIVFAGNLAGRTRTLPLAIYTTLERDLDSALQLAAVQTLVAFVFLGLVKRFARH
jgi:molybdate transport system permease protein